ncbi:IS1595 family transposase [Xanthomonas citri pv. punicae]|nr:IS1595 family transposase [Xanthomonas citri pv. punicae]
MSINAVQFQAGLSMPDFFAAYGTEAKCYRALYRWRWPQGFRCPCCAGRARSRSRFKRGGAIYYQCSACRQIDDAYLGGERNGGKAGRGSENKQPFLIAVQTDASFTAPSFVVIEPVRSFDNAALTDWIARRLKPECEAYTDGLACFRRLEDAGHAHTTLDTGGGRAATEAAGARWVNVVLGNLKRAISGVYHAIAQSKYARRYLAEAAYRFNRRFRLPEMLPRLATAMMRCKPCPEPALRMAGNFHG